MTYGREEKKDVVEELDEKVVVGMRELFSVPDFERVMEFHGRVKEGLCERNAILHCQDHYEKGQRVKIHTFFRTTLK